VVVQNKVMRIPYWAVAVTFLAAARLFARQGSESGMAATSRPGGFQFDAKISRQVLENYLSRSICMEGMLNGRGDLKDNKVGMALESSFGSPTSNPS